MRTRRSLLAVLVGTAAASVVVSTTIVTSSAAAPVSADAAAATLPAQPQVPAPPAPASLLAAGPEPAALPVMGPTAPARVGPQVPPRVGPVAPGADVPVRSSRRSKQKPPARASGTAASRAEIGRAALTALSYDVSRTGFRVEFLPGRKGVLGETFLDERVIRMYVRRGQSVPQVSRVLAHEVGHAVDVAFMTRESRRRWLELRGASGTPWWPGQGVSDFGSGAGDFAEVFARWTLGEKIRFRSTVAPDPSSSALEELARGFFTR